MPNFNTSKLSDIINGKTAITSTNSAVNVAKQQIETAIVETMRTLQLNREDATKFVAGATLLNGRTNGLVTQQTWDNLPPEIRAVLKYGPAELDVNQAVTKLKTYGTPVLIGISLAVALGVGVAATVAIPAALGATVWYVMGLANDWNDVNHWGPQFQQQTALDLVKIAQKNQNIGLTATGVITQTDVKEIYDAYKAIGAIGIENRITGESGLFDVNFLTQCINSIAGYLLTSGLIAKKIDVLNVLNGWITKETPIGYKAPAAAANAVAAAGQSTSGVKIFTGILSQGKLGAGLSFIARQDDLITSIAELQDAAQNNLAAYLLALPGKIVYEVKLVSRIVTASGFAQTGTTQQLVSGYDTYGKPKYRTVTNKFATLTLYFMTDKGTRSKIATIVLGPTDAIKLNPSLGQLSQLEGALQSSVSTVNIGEVKTIQTDKPVTISPPPATPPATQSTSSAAPVAKASATYTATRRPDGLIDWEWRDAKGVVQDDGTLNDQDLAALIKRKGYPMKVPPPYSAPAASQPMASTTGAGASAQSLSEWYAANQKSLPSIGDRATIYQAAGLGQASLYTGTAEQNTKLLNALKAGMA